MLTYSNEKINLFNDDALNQYKNWPSPTVIVCDGPYGINGFPGDLLSPDGLAEWYEPHIKAWDEKVTANTTLWFWGTEIGWAKVHPMLEKYGWKYVCCNIWDKGKSHVAGNVNTKTIRHLPVVTEVCVQYSKAPVFKVGDVRLSMQEWLRYEWLRTGLPLYKTNEACDVVNAATRKYFTKCHLWYMPPPDAFEKIVNYANTYGENSGKPYFSIDGIMPITKQEWEKLRAKFYCPFGITNVWQVSQLRNVERIKNKNKAVHLNQKPLELMSRIISISSDEGDVVWDPFAGLFTTAISCLETNRSCYCAEHNTEVYKTGVSRIEALLNQRS